MDWHPIQGGVVILLIDIITSFWVSYDGLAFHPGRVVILPVTSCWISCYGQASHQGPTKENKLFNAYVGHLLLVVRIYLFFNSEPLASFSLSREERNVLKSVLFSHFSDAFTVLIVFGVVFAIQIMVFLLFACKGYDAVYR